jgi:hypothetical protein
MSTSPYTHPLPLPKAALRRRLEVFSPKLGRRASLGSYDAWRCWLALEANPLVVRFCERPARVAGSSSALLDFWVQLKGDRDGEFWWIQRDAQRAQESSSGQSASSDALPQRLHEYRVRQITSELIASWAVPLANWAQILPYLVSFRGCRDPLLEQSIVVLLSRFVSLDDVIGRFPRHAASQVQAALFQLVANGRVLCPDLAASPLSGATLFRRI